MRIGIVKNKFKTAVLLDHFKDKVLRDLNVSADEFIIRESTDYKSGLRAAQKLLAEECDTLVAMGGDGTVLSVMNALINRKEALLVYPLGTSNDIAKSLGFHSPDDAYNALANQTLIQVPLLWCHYYNHAGQEANAFAFNVGAGLSAKMLAYERVQTFQMIRKVLGDTGFAIAAFLKEISTFKGVDTQIMINGTPVQSQMMTIECCKTNKMGDLHVSPDADIKKQQSLVTLISYISFFNSLKTFYKLLTHNTPQNIAGLHYYGTGIHQDHPCEDVLFAIREKNIPIHLNGEQLGMTPCVCKATPDRICVYSSKELMDE